MSETYTPLLGDEVFQKCKKFSDLFNMYLVASGISSDNVHLNVHNLSCLVDRVDKRRVYYEIFHNELQLNAAKRTALSAYWVLKYKPFTYLPNIKDDIANVNEGFAAFMIFSAIYSDYKKNHISFIQPDDSYISSLLYAFKNWDLSKEAIILLSETLSIALKLNTVNKI